MSDNFLVKLLKNRIIFILHLFSYVAVMGLLILIWAVNGASVFWPFFPMFGWGFGMGFHACGYLMFNEKIVYLTKIREKSTFAILFVFHAWLYISVNLFLIIENLAFNPQIIYFVWPLFFWGIAFCLHALGFFLWDSALQREMTSLKTKYSDYEETKLKMMAGSKIANFWLVLIHIAYYIIVNIWVYSSNIIVPVNMTNTIEMSLGWGTLLGVHLFGYALFYYVDSIMSVLKGLIIHMSLYAAVNGWMLYAYFKSPFDYFWPIFPLILWGILIAFHGFVTIQWDKVKEDAFKTIKNQYGEGYDKYKLEHKARGLIFWKWSFIAHIAIWAVGIILIGVIFATKGVNFSLVIHPLMGWLIGVCVHGSFFLIVQKNIMGFWKSTAIIHLAVFISTSAYLIALNVLTPSIPWSAIAIAGWGIGLGFHLIIAHLVK